MIKAQSIRWSECALWILACWLLIGVRLYRAGEPLEYNDSYQYISVAENIASGIGIETSIVHFDVERRHGVIPAPSTTFPPGYPIVLAAGHELRLRYGTAAVLVGSTSLAGLIIWIVKLGTYLGLSPLSQRIILLMILTNSLILWYSSSVLSEPVFTSLSFGAIALLVMADREGDSARAQIRSLLFGFVLVGLAFYIRYAGIFLFVAICLISTVRLILLPNRRSIIQFLMCSIPGLMMAVLIARNYYDTGLLGGGNDKVVTNALAPILRAAISSLHHIIMGESVAASTVLASAASLVVFLSLVILVFIAYLERSALVKTADDRPDRRKAISLLLIYICVYVVGMILIAHHTVISFGPRMFYPVLPAILIVAAVMLDPLAQAAPAMTPSRKLAASLALTCLLASYLAVNLASVMAYIPLSEHRLVALRFLERGRDGQPLTAWVKANIPADAVILATDGQATAHALHRRTISLVAPEFSSARWDESEVRAVMERFGAEFLILYPATYDGDTETQRDSAFLGKILSGVTPSWLSIVAENPAVEIFRIGHGT